MFTRYLVPAVAVVGLAAAQSSICTQSTATIASQADATALASCSTFKGTLELTQAAAGNIDISGIDQISGDLIAFNATQLTGLSSSTLNSIGGAFTLDQNTILSTLSFNSLTSVGMVNWTALPGLQQLTFGQGISEAGSLLITNTFLQNLEGINLMSVSDFNVNNNPYLTSVSTQLANASGTINFQANGRNFSVEFPNLEWAANMSFSNCSEISMPSLAAVNGTLSIKSNFITNLMAPNLTKTGSDLSIVANSALTNISMPALTSTGGGALLIANNTALLDINGFAKLATMGALDVTGNFTDVALPALSDVAGGFNMQSSGNFSCDPFNSDHSSGIIRGTYVCKPTETDVQSGNSSSTGTSTGSSSTATASKGAAADSLKASNGAIVAGLALLAGSLL